MQEKLKEVVCKANKELVRHKLVILTWGNVSAINRERSMVAIKPSGVEYEKLIPSDIVLVDLSGNIVEGKKRPSSDTLTHLEIYKGFGAGAVVHTHSPYASAFAQAKREIECLGTTHADYFHGNIPVMRELAEEEIHNGYERNTGKAITEHFRKNRINPELMPACLIPGHGVFVWASTLDKALENAVVVEQVAMMNLSTLKLNPTAKEISKFLLDRHYFRKHGKHAYYGQDVKNNP